MLIKFCFPGNTGVQECYSLIAPPEKGVLASVNMNIETLGNLVYHALEKVGTGKSGRPEMRTSLETGHPP